MKVYFVKKCSYYHNIQYVIRKRILQNIQNLSYIGGNLCWEKIIKLLFEQTK